MIRTYNNKPGWVEIRYKVGNTRKRETVKADLAAARVAQIEKDLAAMRIPLTDKEVEEYRAAVHLLPEGMTLVQAVVAALGTPTTPRAEAKADLHGAIDRYVRYCTSKGLSPRTVSDRTQHLNHFETRMDGDKYLPQFDWQTITKYLDDFKSPKTANTRRATLISFFDYWRKISGVPDSAPHPVRQVEARKVAVKDPVPFAPETLHRLVKTAHDRQCPDSLMFLALGAYVGIRACEVGRLTWGSLIDADGAVKKHLALSSAITKTSRRRAIPITSAAAAVISEVMKMHLINPPALDHPVVSRRHRRNITATVEAAGVEWIDNGLRKGYVSSCVALFGAEQTSKYAGHSISVLESNYKALVTEDEAQSWFEVPAFPKP